MAEQDWFGSYGRIEGIADVLMRMSRRVRQPNPLAGGEAELLTALDGFGADFGEWLADAREFARNFA